MESLNFERQLPLSRLSEVDDNVYQELSQLKDELQSSIEATKALTDQLNCLILLVKRGLEGDRASINHLAKISGAQMSGRVMLTELQEEDELGNVMELNKTQDRAVKNWFILVTRLLHREYSREMRMLREESSTRLKVRNAYLDDQISFCQVSMHDQPKFSTQTSHPFSSGMLKPRVKSAPQARKTKQASEEGLPVRELFSLHSGSSQTSQAMSRLHLTATDHPVKKNVNDNNSYYHEDYSDPLRYEQIGLYDSSPFVKRSRPVSASSLRKGDSKRAVPKSAKGERPLKYETTRPVSAKITSGQSNQQEAMQLKQSQPQSSKIRRKRTSENQEKEKPVDTVHNFSDDLKKMNDLEERFKQTTLSLQRKIGIRPEGCIAP